MAKTKQGDAKNTPQILAIVAGFLVVGGLGFFAGQTVDGVEAPSSAAVPPPQVVDAGPQIEIKPGNPVVAKIGKDEITRVDVLNYIQTLPAQTRQLPIGRLYPAALEQVINTRVITDKSKKVNLDSDPKVKERLNSVKANIVREVYLQNSVEKKLTNERLQQAYKAYVAGFPQVEEVRTRHILVEDKGVAKDLIKQIKDGGDFAALAKENSIDATAQNGGEIGYVAKSEVVPAFGEAVFAAELGTLIASPVKSDFGYHVIEVLEKRARPPAPFEKAKPFLEAQLRQILLNETVQEWKAKADIERFDINGEKPVETPAAAEQG